MKTEQANFKLDADTKRKAYAELHRIGIKPTDAVNMLMQNVAMFGKLPFKPGIPNDETIAAMEEAEHPENLRKYGSFKEIREELGI